MTQNNPEQQNAEAVITIAVKDLKTPHDLYPRLKMERQTVSEVVICVPANYSDPRKDETIQAATQAGMEVLCLVHEPTAAAWELRGACTSVAATIPSASPQQAVSVQTGR